MNADYEADLEYARKLEKDEEEEFTRQQISRLASQAAPMPDLQVQSPISQSRSANNRLREIGAVPDLLEN
jgi:hypothetical protein